MNEKRVSIITCRRVWQFFVARGTKGRGWDEKIMEGWRQMEKIGEPAVNNRDVNLASVAETPAHAGFKHHLGSLEPSLSRFTFTHTQEADFQGVRLDGTDVHYFLHRSLHCDHFSALLWSHVFEREHWWGAACCLESLATLELCCIKI